MESNLNIASAEQMAQTQRTDARDTAIKKGTGWFYWIAGTSLVNSAAYLGGASFTFVVGLGATQLIDGIAAAVAQSVDARVGMVVRGVGAGLDLMLASLFVLAAYFGRRGHRWLIMLGMGLYAMDALIFVWVSDWLSVVFHGWALLGLWQAVRSDATDRAEHVSLPVTD